MTTASDLGETEWSEEEFEAVTADFESRGERVERIYPLLPMQEGMLLRHLQDPEAMLRFGVDRCLCMIGAGAEVPADAPESAAYIHPA